MKTRIEAYSRIAVAVILAIAGCVAVGKNMPTEGAFLLTGSIALWLRVFWGSL